MKKLKVMTIVGTRPEIIRLARVLARLDATVDHQLVHTGQNYDYELNQVFFDELGLRTPDHFLQIETGSPGRVYGHVLIEAERVLQQERPDAVLVLGDTNSCIAALAAKRLRIPVYHMEAGNRCYDPNVPEEINRRMIDHLADFNLAYTEHARRNLLAEGLPPRSVYVTGSPMKEVLEHYRRGIDASDVLARLGLRRNEYFIVSVHREENVDNRANLEQLLVFLRELRRAYGLPVVVSTHPRTRKRLDSIGVSDQDPELRFLKPFGFLDYNHLQLFARCAISDSGTISEESAMLGFPAVTVRNAIERPEALETGAIVLAGLSPAGILECIEAVLEQRAEGDVPEVPEDYQVQNTSQRVINLIIGTARLCHQWSGVVSPERYWEED